MNILHLTFHKGTGLEIEYTFKKLGHNVTTVRFDDGETTNNDIYKVTHDRAQKAWNKYKDYYNSFDGIITSDTCPISRTFLQNNWNKLLIIWVCNRFDYSIQPENEDPEFYNLLRDIPNRKNIFIIGNTIIEYVYAKFIKNVNIGELIIQPIGKNLTLETQTKSYNINNSKLFYVPPYHNETIMMNLSEKLTSLGIMNECKRFDNILDYDGVISIPYAWSTIALFERIQLGIINFIPSIPFLLELFRTYGNFWVQPPFNIDNPELLHLFSEFYTEKNKCCFVYFDSWEHLKYQIDTLDYTAKTKEILEFAKNHEDANMNLWKSIFEKYNTKMDYSYLEYLKVYHTDNKIRIGQKRDGGYVIVDLDDYDCYISAGIGDDESFSQEFIEKYPNIGSYFAFDNTIEKLPDNFPKKLVHIRKNIVPISRDDSNHSSLNQELCTYKNIFLKMDIEGGEYSWLLSLHQTLLARCKQLVFEFHGIHNDDWGTELKRKIECLQHLSHTHYLVHVHPNNGGTSVNINGNNMPTVIEVTYVRKDILGDNVELNKIPLPIVDLDYPTQSHIPEMDLSFYPFVN